MIKIPIQTLENSLGIEIKRNQRSVGIDTASRTGVCLAVTTNKHLVLEYSFLDMKSKNKYHKYNTLADYMSNFFQDSKIDVLVIEETFFSRNAKVFQFLSRIGGIVYAIGHTLHIKEKVFISAVESRKALGLPCNKKKEVVHKAFHDLVPGVTIKDIDIIDGIILALNGLIVPQSLI